MKIGILTYHRSPNFGSVMQTICMFRMLSSVFPSADVEVIDLRAARRESLQRRAFVRRVVRRPWRTTCDFLPICRHMLRQSVRLSPRIDDRADGEGAAGIEGLGYDVIVVGSDTVWEINERPEKLPAPNIFFLKDVSGPTKVAFSVSADQTQNTDLKCHPRRDDIRRAVEQFDFITVRDQFTKRCLDELGVDPKRPVRDTADPTLLADWATPDAGVLEQPGLLGHVVIHGGNRRLVVRACRSLGLQEINIYDRMQREWPNVRANAPSDPSLLVQPFQRPAYFVVDRFHAAVFALLMGSGPVIFLERADRYSEGISKGRDLFRNLGLEKWVIRDDSGQSMSSSIGQLIEDWDPTEKQSRLTSFCENQRKTAKQCLTEVADNVLQGAR